MMQKSENDLDVGTHLTVLSESYPMNTNTTGFVIFKQCLRSCSLDECCLSIGMVKDPECNIEIVMNHFLE